MLAPRNIEGALLALDLGTYCGWAVRRTDNSIVSGEQSFPRQANESEGKRLYRFFNWMRRKVREEQVGFIAYENVQFQSTQAQTRLWSGWLTCVLLVSEFERAGCKGFGTGVVKLTASNYGHAGKQRMVEAANRLYDLNLNHEFNENEADALCTLYTAEQWIVGRLREPEKKSKSRPSKKKKSPQSEMF